MKSHIESLKSESEAVGQLNTDVQALTTRLANLEAQGKFVVARFRQNYYMPAYCRIYGIHEHFNITLNCPERFVIIMMTMMDRVFFF